MTIVAILAVLGAADVARAADVAWRTGRQFQTRLAEIVPTLTWSNRPLGEALNAFSHAQEVALFRDRRVDPDWRLTLAIEKSSVGDIPRRVAEQGEWGTCLVGPLIYFGPRDASESLRTVIESRRDDVAKLPAAMRTRWNESAAMEWDVLATPRELIEAWSRATGLEVEGIERVPHDLWPAGQWPPLPAVERLSLLVVGFDLTFQVPSGGDRAILAPIERPVAIVRSHPLDAKTRSLEARAKELAPHAQFKTSGGKLWIKGRLEDQEAIAALLQGGPARPKPVDKPAPAAGGTTVISRLKFSSQPLRPVLEQMSNGLGFTLRIDEEGIRQAGIALDQRVSVEIEKATVDQALAAVLADTGLTFERREKEVLIRAAR